MNGPLNHIHYSNANSRETYYTMHNVKHAHRYGRGEGIKVGVIDWLFGFEKHRGLYAGGADVTGSRMLAGGKPEHGY